MTSLTNPMPIKYPIYSRAFALTFLLTTLWINASEVFRYFVFIMPMMQEYLSALPNVADMNIRIFMVWGIWDTILTFAVVGFSWIYLERVGFSTRNAIICGTCVWASIFVILWLGLYNMNLASPVILLGALPLSWLEMVIAALIVNWSMQWFHSA